MSAFVVLYAKLPRFALEARWHKARLLTYTARVSAHCEVATCMDAIAVLHTVLEIDDGPLVNHSHGLIGRALLCPVATDIALEAARVVAQGVTGTQVDV